MNRDNTATAADDKCVDIHGGIAKMTVPGNNSIMVPQVRIFDFPLHTGKDVRENLEWDINEWLHTMNGKMYGITHETFLSKNHLYIVYNYKIREEDICESTSND